MSEPSTILDRRQVEQLVRQVLRDHLSSGAGTVHQPPSHHGGVHPLVVNASPRHVHLCQADLEILFGPGAKLTKLKDLYQQGEFTAQEQVNIIGPPNRMIPGVRIFGPCRDHSQVELACTEGVYLGVDLPLRLSGDHRDTPGCILVGPKGALNLHQGLIRAARHVHMHPLDAEHYGVFEGGTMRLKVDGPCGMIFDNLKVRISPRLKLEVNLDTDEGNACHLPSVRSMELIA